MSAGWQIALAHVLSGLVSVMACKSSDPSSSGRAAPSQLQPGPISHEELSAELVARITKLHDTFQDVDPTPLAQWIEDFKRDHHPEHEVEVYEAMARAFTAFSRDRALSLDEKREAYGVVIQRSAAPADDVLKRARIKALTLEDVQAILKLYDMPPNPISVTPTPPQP